MHGYEHPNIYRGIFIEGNDYSPDFLSHLVVFGLKLRNRGIRHDLIVVLSEFLAGSIYYGTQGHSTLYEESITYELAVLWGMGSASGKLETTSFSAPNKVNPYYLPWIMCEFMQEKRIEKDAELKSDLNELIEMFREWQPGKAASKELKYRLEPLKSKL